jgi:hypothetical protein
MGAREALPRELLLVIIREVVRQLQQETGTPSEAYRILLTCRCVLPRGSASRH